LIHRHPERSDAMRDRLLVVILAAVAVIAAGCGTRQASAVALSAAVTNTAATSSRVAISTTMSGPGVTTTITATGEFDYALRRGVLQMGGGLAPGGVEVRFLPPRIYVRIADAAGMALPSGKSWIEIPLVSQANASLPFLPPGDVNASPMDLLSALTAIASNVTNLGSATVRGVVVTHYRVTVDLAKAEAHQQPQARAEFHAFARSLNATTLPVDVWVDGQAMVRRLAVSLPMPSGYGTPAGLRLSEAVDFYDFGVPVLVSAPPASEVISANEFSQSMASSGQASPPLVSPPPVSGTLSAAQASAAEQAVRAFWMALSSNSAQAIERTVLPSQRDCVASFLQGPNFKFKVSSLQITAAKAAGTGKATVWFSVNATVQIGGQTIPMTGGPASTNWMLATESGGAWYADLSNSGSGFLPPCPPTGL
jgi:hypothetical protein